MSGDQTVLENKGGETHTFTRVDQFGGGLARLNGLTGNPVPAAECAQVLPDGSLAPQPESPTNQFVEAGKTEAGPTAEKLCAPAGSVPLGMLYPPMDAEWLSLCMSMRTDALGNF